MKRNRTFLPQPITFWPLVCGLVVSLCLGWAGLLSGRAGAEPVWQSPDIDSDLNPEQQADLDYHGNNLRNPAGSLANRARAAQYLVRMRVPEAVSVLDEALAGSDPDMIGAVVLALSGEPAVPASLLDGLTAVLAGANGQRIQRIAGIVSTFGDPGAQRVAAIAVDQAADPELRLGAVRVLGHLRSTDVAGTSVDTLVTIVQQGESTTPELRSAAFAGLVALTNQESLGDDPAAWLVWWNSSRNLPVRDWLPDELQRLGDQINGLQQDLAASDGRNTIYHTRLLEVLSALYFRVLAESDEAMYTQLAAWIRDDFQPIRRFAVDRADLRVAQAQGLSTEVDQALAERLADPGETSAIRGTSARILDRRNFTQIGPLVAKAIDPNSTPALQEYLNILERRPAIEALPVLQIILASAEGPRDSAARCVLAVIDAGLMDDAARQTMRGAARAGLEHAATPDAIALLARVGVEEDITRLLELLGDADDQIRSAASSSLTSNPAARDAILSRGGDPAIFPAALAIHAAGAPTATQFATLVAATPPDLSSVAGWEAEVRGFGARLPVADLTTADATLVGLPPEHVAAGRIPSLREAVLARVVTTAPENLPAVVRSALLLTLAQLRESLGRPADVIAALDALNGNGAGSDAEKTRLRFVALLRLGHFDDAITVEATETQWLATFNTAVDTEPDLANALKAEIPSRFPGLAGPQLAQFNAIVARLDGGAQPENPGGDDPDASSGGT